MPRSKFLSHDALHHPNLFTKKMVSSSGGNFVFSTSAYLVIVGCKYRVLVSTCNGGLECGWWWVRVVWMVRHTMGRLVRQQRGGYAYAST